MVKRKVGNRVYITTEPKVAVYVPTYEDNVWGMKGSLSRTIHENDESIERLTTNLNNKVVSIDSCIDKLVENTGCKTSTIESLIKDPHKAQMSVLLKVCNYLNLELKDLL